MREYFECCLDIYSYNALRDAQGHESTYLYYVIS